MLSVLIVLLLAINIVAVYVAYSKLSRGTHIVRHELQAHANNVIVQIESLLAVYAELAPKRGLPRTRGWAASPDLLALLVSLVHERHPRTILECSSGLSTLILAACMRNNGAGRVVSLEHDPAYADKTRAMLERHELQDWAEVVVAPLVPLELDGWSGRWYDITRLEPGLVVDLPVLRSRLGAGAAVVLDDADRPDEIEAVRRWMANDPGLQALRVAKCEKGCRVLSLVATAQ